MEDDKMKEWIEELSDEELIHCARAAGLADTEPARPADLERAAHFVGSHVSKKKSPRILLWTSASLLAVAAGLAAIFFTIRPGQTVPSGMIAETDEEMVGQAAPEEELPVGNAPVKIEPVKPSVKTPQAPQETILKEGLAEKTYASETEVRDFMPIKPDKAEYRIRVVNEDKCFTFRWDPAQLASLELILQDENGEPIEKHQFTSEDHFDFPASTGVLHHAVHWKMKVQYKDGAEGAKSGIIYFDKVKE